MDLQTLVADYLDRKINQKAFRDKLKELGSPKTLTQLNSYIDKLDSGTYSLPEFWNMVSMPKPEGPVSPSVPVPQDPPPPTNPGPQTPAPTVPTVPSVPVPATPPSIEEMTHFLCSMGVRMNPFVPDAWPNEEEFRKKGIVSSAYAELQAFRQDPKWTALLYSHCPVHTSFGIESGFLRTSLSDGPTCGAAPFTNNNYAALVLLPTAIVDWETSNPVLHVSWKVDPHWTGRRWCELIAYEAGLPLFHPNELMNSTPKHGTGVGQYLQWAITGDYHLFNVYTPNPAGGLELETAGIDIGWGPDSDRFNPLAPNVGRGTSGQVSARDNLNGTTELLGTDKLRKFDFYMSRDKWACVEKGLLIDRGDFKKRIDIRKVQFGWIHMAYHLSLEHTGWDENRLPNGQVPEPHYFNQTPPYIDTHFWDDFKIASLKDFPELHI